MKRIRILLALGASLPLAAGCSQQSQPAANEAAATDTSQDEQAIRAINARWLQLLRAKDSAGIAQIYAEDGVAMPANEPALRGREAIGAWWGQAMQLPGYDLTFETDKLVVSKSGDMALDLGTYRFRANPPSGAIDDTGKFVVVWRKVGDEWKVAADIFNSDRPAAGG